MDDPGEHRSLTHVDVPTIQQELHVPDLEAGLSSEDAKKRLAINGPNALESHVTPKWVTFIRQFNNLIIYILIGAAIMTSIMGLMTDTIIIALVIVINAFIGYFQEVNASNALEKIKQMLAHTATVYRDGQRVDVDTADLVTGDVVFLEAGDNVPADLRLFDVDNLTMMESALTGESNSVEKQIEPLEGDVPLAEQSNMAFASTAVASGSGMGIVVATGIHTELGKISQAVADVRKGRSPLMKELDGIGKGISIGILVFAVALFIFGLFTGRYTVGTLALAVVTMIVGSLPEGLPATTSVVLAMGMQNMAKHNNTIVKTLPGAETLGSVDVIATDKTGTLTKNEMTMTDVITPAHHYAVTGTGYAPTGQFTLDGAAVSPADQADLQELLIAGFQANDTTLAEVDGVYEINGEPTDGAFMTAYQKGFSADPAGEELDFLPFDSDYRYMAKLVELPDGTRKIYLKGSPDKVFPMAKNADPHFDEQAYLALTSKLSRGGQRVIAVAEKVVGSEVDEITLPLCEEGMQFLGIAALIDPPRDEVIASIKQMHKAGVRVVMITGDHPETASAIAATLGIAKRPRVVTGTELAQMDDAARFQAMTTADVFARTTPADKLAIVTALQEAGNVTAMVGDGVNDAPALKKADVGVAMGVSGTDVAKDAADIILTDDKFTTMEKAIAQGRRIYDNLKKSVLFLLPTSFAEGLIIAFTVLTQDAMPLNAPQMLWINMVSAITIQFAFIFEPAEPGIMERPPRSNTAGMMNKHDIFQLVYVSVLISGLGLIAHDYLLSRGIVDAATASTMMVNIVILGKIFYLFNIRTKAPAFSKQLFTNPMAYAIIGLMMVLQLILTYVPFMQNVMGTSGMSLREWGIAIAIGFIVLVVTEIDKLIRLAYAKEAAKPHFRAEKE
ncbi:HAD-IC family P-type ATPase [Lacticaseibacillus mingshuiensis]|uniref:HAD-IC family P-type ATPase n=1 Tax=Lacticaseibacillus mingshuiensis TaxID=2799574 RepID=A0ABW4CFM1_9LACO|nr:HAD-IC family P-type ATPase [Lacticaseibacillus mingshuiensis]